MSRRTRRTSPLHSTTDDTYLHVGDRVLALQSVQGLQKGAPYSVVEVHDRRTVFGTFVTYELTDGTDRYLVGNGHLLLQLVERCAAPLAPEDVEDEADREALAAAPRPLAWQCNKCGRAGAANMAHPLITSKAWKKGSMQKQWCAGCGGNRVHVLVEGR